MFETWVFYILATVLLVSGVLVITARNPVHGVLFLVLAFFTAAGIWLLLRVTALVVPITVTLDTRVLMFAAALAIVVIGAGAVLVATVAADAASRPMTPPNPTTSNSSGS